MPSMLSPTKVYYKRDTIVSSVIPTGTSSNGCVECPSTLECPICSSDEYCVMSALTCEECPTVYCAKKDGSDNDYYSSSADATASTSDATAASSTSAISGTSTSGSSSHSKNGNDGAKIGGIVGGVVGGVSFIVLLTLLYLYYKYYTKMKYKKQCLLLEEEKFNQQHQHPDNTSNESENKDNYTDHGYDAVVGGDNVSGEKFMMNDLNTNDTNDNNLNADVTYMDTEIVNNNNTNIKGRIHNKNSNMSMSDHNNNNGANINIYMHSDINNNDKNEHGHTIINKKSLATLNKSLKDTHDNSRSVVINDETSSVAASNILPVTYIPGVRAGAPQPPTPALTKYTANQLRGRNHTQNNRFNDVKSHITLGSSILDDLDYQEDLVSNDTKKTNKNTNDGISEKYNKNNGTRGGNTVLSSKSNQKGSVSSYDKGNTILDVNLPVDNNKNRLAYEDQPTIAILRGRPKLVQINEEEENDFEDEENNANENDNARSQHSSEGSFIIELSVPDGIREQQQKQEPSEGDKQTEQDNNHGSSTINVIIPNDTIQDSINIEESSSPFRDHFEIKQ
ncbi:Opy2p SCDLUD_000588 [Saccharomycodes ludwigii]|uniref:Opy2p n=1 Tax=Saccharomycodes ludwigii TaxID=36035 RepID=UPI001E8B67EF|nr:hypothetical protein SCDLUD_000588 [Saccharomycodes ludwigii]KAH3902986.1 hypothetical protein SCDLUD_000588 [Saccharomycodes ludwigii]